MNERERQVEFLGGPFDGYRHTIANRPSQRRITLPVTRRARKDHSPQRRAPTTSLAVYELAPHARGWVYRFLHALADVPALRGEA